MREGCGERGAAAREGCGERGAPAREGCGERGAAARGRKRPLLPAAGGRNRRCPPARTHAKAAARPQGHAAAFFALPPFAARRDAPPAQDGCSRYRGKVYCSRYRGKVYHFRYRGKVTVKVVPSVLVEVSSTFAPYWPATCLTIASPSPVPPIALLRPLSIR